MRTCFDANLLGEIVQHATEQTRQKNADWRPHLHCGVPADFCELCLGYGASGLSVSTIAESAALAALGHRSLFVSLPPALSELPMISRISESTELILSIDHFVHAEQIAAQTEHCPAEHAVAILLQTDKSGPGIRPGQDALQLARGVNELIGVHVIGLTASIADDQDSESAMRAVAHTQQQFLESGISCGFVSIAANIERVPADGRLVTEIRDQTVFQAADRARPLVWLEAEVVSRPSLQVVVVGVGQSHLEDAGNTWFPDFPDAQVLHCFDDCTAMTAAGDANLLTIGDVVRVACSNVSRRLQN